MSKVRGGDRFVTTQDVPTNGLSTWRAPFTGGFETVIPEGTVLVADEQVAGASGFGCIPERYRELEPALVPEDTRSSAKYDGYYFVFLLSDLGKTLKRLRRD